MGTIKEGFLSFSYEEIEFEAVKYSKEENDGKKTCYLTNLIAFKAGFNKALELIKAKGIIINPQPINLTQDQIDKLNIDFKKRMGGGGYFTTTTNLPINLEFKSLLGDEENKIDG